MPSPHLCDCDLFIKLLRVCVCACVCGQPHKHPQAAEQADEHFLMYLASNNANHRQKVQQEEQVKYLSQGRLRKEGIFPSGTNKLQPPPCLGEAFGGFSFDFIKHS